jgi:PAS domain S-box-containing protein
MIDEPPRRAIVVVDRQGLIRLWGGDAEILTGHAPARILGLTLDVIVPPEYRDRHWVGFHNAMDTGTAEAEGAPINLPIHCADGTIKRLPKRFTLIRDVQGHALGAVAVITDPQVGDPPLFEL